MNSLRRTLLTRLAGGSLVLLLIGVGCLQVGVRWLLTEQFDDALESELTSLAALIEQEGNIVELGFAEQSRPEFEVGDQPHYLQLWIEEDVVAWRSPSLASEDLPRVSGENGPAFFDLDLPDGRAGRACGATIVVGQYEPFADDDDGAAEDDEDETLEELAEVGPARLIMVLARDRRPLDDGLAMLLWATGAGVVVLLAGGLWLGRTAVDRGLRPVDAFTRHVEGIQDPVRAKPFPPERVPLELRPILEEHNRLLERIRLAFERERRTTANIAHELRTPVAELVILSDVAVRYIDDPEETAKALRQLHELGDQMRRLITTLLELSNLESGRVPLEPEQLDLADMVRACWRPLAEAAGEKHQGWRFEEGEGPTVSVDRAALSMVLTNLLGNAVEYAPPGTNIECALSNGGSDCSLILSNVAQDIEPEDMDKLTEPFWRASASRADRAHAGIGLALAQRLSELQGLRLSFELEDSAFRAELEFPGLVSNGSNGKRA